MPALLIILGIGHVKFAAARACRTENLARALEEIAEGSSSWRKDWPSQALMSGLGEGMRVAVEELAEKVEALRREKRRAELVLANMNDGVISVDCEGRITLFNRAASAFFGHKEAQLLGKKLEEADLHPEIVRLAYECFRSSGDLTAEITLPGQPQKALRIHAAPHRAPGSECAVIVLQDLTDIRRHERYEKEFASNVSHELRTPIAGIRSIAEALLSGAKNDQEVVDSFLNTIISESDRLSALIDDMMEIAKLDAGVAVTRKAISAVADVVDRAITILKPHAENRNIELQIGVPEDLTGFFDPNQILQVVRNLVDNAIKYTPESGSVEVGARNEGADLLIWVKDTGIGIPHGEMDRIFDRFYRVDKARSRRLGGTGLGLAIVKDIVDAHGGRITVDTQLGRGSTFTVVLPGSAESS